jgi:hypothetical protein
MQSRGHIEPPSPGSSNPSKLRNILDALAFEAGVQAIRSKSKDSKIVDITEAAIQSLMENVVGPDEEVPKKTIVGVDGRLTYAPGVSISKVIWRNQLRAEWREWIREL